MKCLQLHAGHNDEQAAGPPTKLSLLLLALRIELEHLISLVSHKVHCLSLQTWLVRSKCGELVMTNLAAPIHLSLQPDTRPSPNVNCPHPLGSINLVPADRHQVDVVLIDIDWDLAYSLCCVCMEEDFALSAHLANLLCGLDDSCNQW